MRLPPSQSIRVPLRELAKQMFLSLFWKAARVFAIVLRAMHKSYPEEARRILNKSGQLLGDRGLPATKHKIPFRNERSKNRADCLGRIRTGTKAKALCQQYPQSSGVASWVSRAVAMIQARNAEKAGSVCRAWRYTRYH
jgi:hypothetical protein